MPHDSVATFPTTALPNAAANDRGAGFPLAKEFAGKIAPTKTRFASRIEAQLACESYATAHGGSVEITSGTRSMEPFIHGQTYFVVQKRPYESITHRDLLVYMGRPDASKPDRIKILHRAVDHDRYGWIMSGDNNRWSETWDRVAAKTYVGTAVAFFEFPQS